MKKIIFLLILFIVSLYAQEFDGSSLGMGGNYTAKGLGIDALYWNPANLALPRGNAVELNLLSLNSSVYNNSFSFHTYNRYFTQAGNPDNFLDEQEKKDFLGLISGNQIALDIRTNTNVLGLAFNNFGMAVQAVAYGHVAVNRRPLDMALNGEGIDSTYVYHEPNQASGSSYSAAKISIGYAYPFRISRFLPGFSDLAVGFAVNYYIGIGVAQVRQVDAMLKRIPGDDESIVINAMLRARFATPDNGLLPGRGKGFDFGFSSGYGSRWKFGLSFSDIGSSINWSANTQQHVTMHYDSVKTLDLINGNNNGDHAVDQDTTTDIASFSTKLPAIMRIGVAYRFFSKLLLTADYRQGLNKAFGNPRTPRVGVGAEYTPLDWLPVRGGFALGGNESFLIAMGFGLHFRFFDFDYSIAMKNALWPTHSEGVFTALSFKLKL